MNGAVDPRSPSGPPAAVAIGPGGSASLTSAARVAAFAAAFVTVYLVLVRTTTGQYIDAGSFGVFAPLHELLGDLPAVLRSATPPALGALIAVAGVIGIMNREWAALAHAALIVAGSVGIAELLKTLLPRPELGIGSYVNNTFPSGHVAFALGVGLAVGLLGHRFRWGRAVFVFAVLAALVLGWASIITYAHRPSDVIGAALLVGGVASLVLWGRPSKAKRAPGWTVAACLGVGWVIGAIGMAALPATSSPLAGAEAAAGWLAVVAGAVGIVVFAAPRVDEGEKDGRF